MLLNSYRKGFATAFVLFHSIFFAQTGISVSPPRVYFEMQQGTTLSQKISVANVSEKNTLDIAASLGDWEYDLVGENRIELAGTLKNSASNWVVIRKEDSYFTLKPGEKKEVEVIMTAPSAMDRSVPVHTAMLYFTQMNPIEDVDKEGTRIKISVRSGIKLFQRDTSSPTNKIEIQNLALSKDRSHIELTFQNQGNIWENGIAHTELLNSKTGKKTKLPESFFYTMPNDVRLMKIALPNNLEKGSYVTTIILDIGDENSVEMAELSFEYEK